MYSVGGERRKGKVHGLNSYIDTLTSKIFSGNSLPVVRPYFVSYCLEVLKIL
jgi:hypothetical protein